MSDTPNTDAKAKNLTGNFAMCYGIMEEFARNLERKLRTASMCELAGENDNLRSYMEHWEGRALKAEKDFMELRAELAKLKGGGK